jgi:hypothetical protein
VPDDKKESESQASEAKDRPERGRQATPGPAPTSPRLPLKNWDELKTQLVGAVRRSERLTKEDLSIRINAKK